MPTSAPHHPLLVPLHLPWLASGCRRQPPEPVVPGKRCLAAASAVGLVMEAGGSCSSGHL